MTEQNYTVTFTVEYHSVDEATLRSTIASSFGKGSVDKVMINKGHHWSEQNGSGRRTMAWSFVPIEKSSDG